MRDYAKKEGLLGNAASKPRTRNAPRQPQKPPKAPFQIPAWVWMLSGLLVGIILVIFGWSTLHKHRLQHRKQVVAKPEQSQSISHTKNATPSVTHKLVKATQAKNSVAKPQVVKPQFDFYSILPNRKIASGVKPGDQVSTSHAQFMLQVASYRDQKDAKAMRARLLLLGLKPTLEQVGTGSNIWYRVDLGPYPSVRKADVVRHTLQNGGVNGAMIRQVKP